MTSVLPIQAAAEGIPGARPDLPALGAAELDGSDLSYTQHGLFWLPFYLPPPKKETQKAQARMCHLLCQAAEEIKRRLLLYQTLQQAGEPCRRDVEQGRLVAIADAGVGTAAALLIGWRCLCRERKQEERL